ncbi:MAG: hypothetical protein AAFR27_12335, partial [Pseudomonadota bacterium]
MKYITTPLAAAVLSASAFFSVPASASELIVDQFGIGNVVGGGQNGIDNRLNFKQRGEGNLATGTQSGDNNWMAVHQHGDGHVSQNDQVGDNNITAVI